MTIELMPEQRNALLDLVNRELLELGPEIHHTWTRDYREDLKNERRVLSELRNMLAGVPAAAAPAGAASDDTIPRLGAI